MGIAGIYLYMTVGIVTVISVPETAVASPLIGNINIDVNKRSVSCLSGSYYDAAIGGCQACITCGKGELFNDDCYGTIGPGTCSPCGRNYYQSKENHADVYCFTCKHCQNRVRVSKCTRTENTVCGDCLPGYYEETFNRQTTCLKCPTKGFIPKSFREKPSTTTIPPVPPTATTTPLTTMPPLTTTSPYTTTPISTTSLSLTTASSTTAMSFNGWTKTPAMATNAQMTTSYIPNSSHVKNVASGALYPNWHWSPIFAVLLLFFLVFFGCLFYNRGCKRNSSSAITYSQPPVEDGTHEHTCSHVEGSGENDEAGNYGGEHGEIGENNPMLQVLHKLSGLGADSIGTTPNTSSTSSPRVSLYSDDDSVVSWTPSFNGLEVTWIKDNPHYKSETKLGTHAPDISERQKQLLADVSVKLNQQISNDLLNDFKIYCRLCEKLEIRTTESCTSFSECIDSLIQHNDFTPDAVATFLSSYFESKNLRRCLNIVKQKFPHVSSEDKTSLDEDVLPSNLQRADCDGTYYWKLVECFKKNNMTSLKLKDITTIVAGIDSMLECDIKGVGSMFAITVTLNVKQEVAHSLKRYRSLESLLTMSKPDLTVIEFAHVLTLHNRIAAVEEIYKKLSCNRTMEKLKRGMFNGQTSFECTSKQWNML